MSNNRSLINAFLDAWVREGGPDGVDLRLRIYQALAVPGPWTRQRLRNTLRTILAFDTRRRETFDRLFDTFYPTDDLLPPTLRTVDDNQGAAELETHTAPKGSVVPSDHAIPQSRPAARVADDASRVSIYLRDTRAAVDAPAKPEPWAPNVVPSGKEPTKTAQTITDPPRFTQLFSYAVALGLAVGVGSTIWLAAHVPAEQTEIVQPDAGHADASASTAPAVPPITSASAPEGKAQPIPRKVKGKPLSRPDESYQWLGFLTAGMCLLFAIGAVIAARGAQPIRASRPPSAPIPQSEPPPPRPPVKTVLDERPRGFPHPLMVDELRRLANGIGLTPDWLQQQLDVRATVEETARNAGILAPVYVPGRVAAPLVILFTARLDLVAHTIFVEDFVPKMRSAGVDVVEVIAHDGPPPVLGGDAFVLVVVDASKMPVWLTEAWLRRYSCHIALVESRDPMLWGPDVAMLPWAPFTPDAGGLMRALEAADNMKVALPPRLWAAPRNLAALDDALPLAAAAALAEPCNLVEIEDLRRELQRSGIEVSPFSGVQRIFRLEDVTADPAGIRFSARLKKELVARASDEVARVALEWNKKRLQKRFESAKKKDAALRLSNSGTNPDVRMRAVSTTDMLASEVALAEFALAIRNYANHSPGRLELAVSELKEHADGDHGRRFRKRLAAMMPLMPIGALPKELGFRLENLLREPAGTAASVPTRAPEPEMIMTATIAKGKLAMGAACAVIGIAAAGFAAGPGQQPQSCDIGLDRCEDPPTCYNLQENPDHCGQCPTQCNPTEICGNGKCQCKEGWTRCPDEQCADTRGDTKNCGSCGNKCPENVICLDGVCEKPCENGMEPCGQDCVDIDTDSRNCGSCGLVCDADKVCLSGFCAVPRSCVPNPSFDTDRHNCGSCGHDCASSVRNRGACRKGVCERCQTNWRNCDLEDDDCDTNIMNDTHNCGGCSNSREIFSCAEKTVATPNTVPACAEGTCTRGCRYGFDNCDGDLGNGCEINIMNDIDHCGDCGTRCPPRLNAKIACISRHCESECIQPFDDCDSNTTCETNLQSDVRHCGNCQTSCGAPANAQPSCNAGKCVFTCNAGLTLCAGACVTTDNEAHCGGCAPCQARTGQTARCVNGICERSCEPNRNDCDGDRTNGCELEGACPPANLKSDSDGGLEPGTGRGPGAGADVPQ